MTMFSPNFQASKNKSIAESFERSKNYKYARYFYVEAAQNFNLLKDIHLANFKEKTESKQKELEMALAVQANEDANYCCNKAEEMDKKINELTPQQEH